MSPVSPTLVTLQQNYNLSSEPKRGDKGPAVVALQQMLANAGFDPGPIDGDFGKKTQAALQQYEQTKILDRYNPKTPANISDATQPPPPFSPPSTGGVAGPIDIASMKRMSVADLKKEQTFLKGAGYNPGTIDGKWGPKTETAYRNYMKAGQAQDKFMTTITGGPSADVTSNSPAPSGVIPFTPPSQSGFDGIVNLAAMKGLGVDALKHEQTFLKEAGFDPGKVDGKWGPKTEKAYLTYMSAGSYITAGNAQDKYLGYNASAAGAGTTSKASTGADLVKGSPADWIATNRVVNIALVGGSMGPVLTPQAGEKLTGLSQSDPSLFASVKARLESIVGKSAVDALLNPPNPHGLRNAV